MATNTPNLNLVKPEMADYADIRVLNQNMDILDSAVGTLDYVKDVSKSDTGLTFTKKDDSQITVPLDYMPVSGGNFTGNITVQNNQVVTVVDVITSDKQISIKYSDGTLKQYGTLDNTITEVQNIYVPLTFQVPFLNTEYCILTTVRGDKYDKTGKIINYSNEVNSYINDVTKTSTGCVVALDDYATGAYFMAIGKWK